MYWTWSGYDKRDDLRLPDTFESYLDGKLMKSVSMQVEFDVPDDAFEVPDGIEVAPPPPVIAEQFVPHGERLPVVETIAERVHLVRNLRPGFHPMFVEFDNYVVAIDAPAGWYEMQQIPPMNWSFGDDSSALGEKFLRAIDQAIPGKPVRYLVLTHHHSDHIGGLRPFVAAGATIIAARPAATMAERAVGADFTLAGDQLRSSGAELELDIIDNEMLLSDGSQTIHLVPLPADNPKAAGYLAVYLPIQKLLYATGFIYPVPEDVFPLAESIDLSRYFVDWLDASGLEVEHVYNVHGMARVEDWQLAYFRDYDPTEGVTTAVEPTADVEPDSDPDIEMDMQIDTELESVPADND
ncbi:MAG: MBL fold metallo-hydrolase [Gammaproteobacteria bacterium]|nr:MBL fold metallo-hydrolase [Gammaproteobacteria bacterium]